MAFDAFPGLFLKGGGLSLDIRLGHIIYLAFEHPVQVQGIARARSALALVFHDGLLRLHFQERPHLHIVLFDLFKHILRLLHFLGEESDLQLHELVIRLYLPVIDMAAGKVAGPEGKTGPGCDEE